MPSRELRSRDYRQASAVAAGQPTLRSSSTFRATGQFPCFVEPHAAALGLKPHVCRWHVCILKAGYVKEKIVGCLRSCNGIQGNNAWGDNFRLVDVALSLELSFRNTFVLQLRAIDKAIA
jgi:hypothetical protein